MSRRSIMNEPDVATEINLSPMIDCIFILLIFFIVTTVFVEEGVLSLAERGFDDTRCDHYYQHPPPSSRPLLLPASP